MSDLLFVGTREDWEKIQRRLPSIGAHGKVINSLHLIVNFALNNPDLQLEVIRKRLSISRAAMKKYAELLGILKPDTEEELTMQDGTLLEELQPLVKSGVPIPLTRLARQYGVSVSYVYDKMRELMAEAQ